MTDAYEDLFISQEGQNAPGGASFDVHRDDSHAQAQHVQSNIRRDQRYHHTDTAEQRRKDFRAWLLHRARHSSGGTQKAAERAAAEERRARRLEQLQARLAAAEVNRATSLAQLQRRVAATSQRREDAAERAAAAAAERASVAAERLEAELAAAESRREALRGAELERLRAEHELVLSRLVSSQERAAAGAEQQRSRLEARLRSAASEREARLARRAARAGSKVERARARGAQTREMQQQEIESRRQALEQKLETARRRRQDLRPLPAAAVGVTAAAIDSPQGTTSPSAASQSLQSKSPSPSLPSSPIRSPQRSRAAAGGGGDAAPRDLVVAVPSESHSDDGGSSDDATATAAIMATSETDILEAMVADISTAASEGSGGAAAVAADSSDDSGGATAAAAAAAEAEAEAEAEVSSRLEGLRRSISSRRLQQVWREFVQSKRTTRTLAEAFVAQGITNVRLPAAPMPSEAAMAAEDAAARAAGAVDVPRRPGPAPGPAAVNTAAVVIGLGSPSPRGSAAAAAMARMEPQGHSQGDEGGDGFDRFASALRSPTTLKATQALMRRLEQRLEARLAVPSSLSGSKSQHSNQGPSQVQCSSPDGSTSQSPAATSVSRLLRLLYPTAPRNATLERYPPRVLLCAFMIVRHPEVVFSGSGPREVALAAAARDLVDRFETLLERIIFAPAEVPPAAAAAAAAPEPAGPLPWSSPPTYVAASPVARGMEELIRRQRATAAAAVLGGGGSFGLLPPTSPSGSSSPYMTIGSLMVQFDDAWLRYLDQFVAWKGADAASLESELVRCSAALESSMLRKCRGNPFSDRVRRSSDLQAVIAQVAHDQSLLRERIAKLGGEAGLGRLQAALEAARQAVAAELAERGAGGAGSGSGTPSEADTTDAESPSARYSPRRSPASTTIRRGPYSPTAAAASTSPTLSRQATPAPLSLDTPPVAAPSPAAAVVPAAASAPIPAPPRPLRPRGELNWPGYVDTDTTPHFGDGGGASGSGVGGAGGGNSTVANSDRGGGGGGGGGGAAVAPSPLSASPKSPGSLRSTLLGPEGAAEGSAVHAVTPLDTALISNAALVHEMLLAGSTGSYRLPTAEAEASWNRAVAAVSLDAGGLAVLHSEAPLEPGELQHMSQEQLIRTLRSRTAAIAECAFWDNVIATLALALQPLPAGLAATRGSSVARLAGVLAPLLSEVAFDVAAIVSPPQQAFALRAEFSESVIRSKITAGAAAGSGGGGGGSSGADGGGAAVVAAVQGALGVLQRLAGLLVAAGAPAREEAALSAQGLMQQRLGAALTEFAQKQQQQPSQDAGAGSDVSEGEGEGEGAALPPPSPLAAALGRAVRLLAAQVKLLRVDAANGRLQALAASLHGDGGVSYLRSKFAAIFRLEGPSGTATAITTTANADAAVAATGPPASPTSSPPRRLQGQDLQRALPRTATWLHRSRGAAAGIASYIRAQGIDLTAATAAAAAAAAAGAAAGAPFSLRAGLRAPRAGDSAAAAGASAVRLPPPVPPVVPIGPDSSSSAGWRWTVRCGLVGLVSSESPAVGPSLAETLLWDGERLHSAQNQFQQLVVVTAGMLLVAQLRSATAAAAGAGAGAGAGTGTGGSVHPATAATAAASSADPRSGWGPEARSAAARRLLAVLADPGMRLPDLTSELAAMAGMAGDEAAEARLRSTFVSLVDPASGAFRSITNALAAALLAHITLGTPTPPTTQQTQGSVAGASGGGFGGGPAAAVAAMLLGRVGASHLAADVAALGAQLLALCAVNEAVHGELYEEMYGQIMQDEEEATAAEHPPPHHQHQHQESVRARQTPSSPPGPPPPAAVAAAAAAAGATPGPGPAAPRRAPPPPRGAYDDDSEEEEEEEEQRLEEGDEI